MATRRMFRIQKKSAILNKPSLWGFTILLFSVVAGAQTKSKLPGIEIFGGYSHLSFQSGGLGFTSNTQMNGWDFAITVPHIVSGLGITADASGDYTRELEQYNFMIGPQYGWDWKKLRFIGHILYGRARTRVRLPGSTFTEPSDLHRALAFGGEVDIPLSDRFSVRVVQADYLVTSAFGGTQDNVRISTGLIFRFGKH
jgi:hypothetical protein